MNNSWGAAFSGGGQRGFAHIGIIRALEEKEIVPCAVTGTSAGSIFGAFWACGKSSQDMGAWALELSTRNLLDFYFSVFHLLQTVIQLVRRDLVNLSLPPAIFRGEKIYRALLNGLGGVRIKDVPLPLAIIAVDLDTGEEVLFCNHPQAALLFGAPVMPDTVKVADAVRASIGVPGIFAPWEVAGRRLIDGGLADNLPARKARLLGAKKLIVADVGEPIPFERLASRSLPGIAERSVSILTRQLVQCRQESADIFIAPELPQVMIGDFGKNRVLMERGYTAAIEALGRL